MAKGPANFANMRARLQRLKDAKFFTGWISDFDGHEVRVRLGVAGECEPGDLFMFEIYGTELDAIFQARVTMAFDNQSNMSVVGGVSYRPATENARICVSGMFGVVGTPDGDIEVRVTDISVNGLGLVIRKPLKQKMLVKLRLTTAVGEVTGEGEVRYCRLDPAGTGSYRAGLRLSELGRLEKARWLRLFDRDAA